MHPKCIARENECPPEDVGGTFGYRKLKFVLTNPGQGVRCSANGLARPSNQIDLILLPKSKVHRVCAFWTTGKRDRAIRRVSSKG